MAAKVSTLASETAGTIEALRKRQSEAETRAESADAEIQTHARRLRGILGDGSGSAAVEGYVGELQESNAELHAAVRKLRERVEAVAETAEAAAPGRATRDSRTQSPNSARGEPRINRESSPPRRRRRRRIGGRGERGDGHARVRGSRRASRASD